MQRWPRFAATRAPPAPYPAWFLETPGGGTYDCAVGYARECVNFETSRKEAETIALVNLAKCVRVHIAGEHAFESAPRGRVYRGSSIRERVDSLLVEGLAAVAVYSEPVLTNGMMITLASTTGTTSRSRGPTRSSRGSRSSVAIMIIAKGPITCSRVAAAPRPSTAEIHSRRQGGGSDFVW